MSNDDRNGLYLAIHSDRLLFTAGYESGMAHGIMIPGDYFGDPLAYTTADGKIVKACGGYFTLTNSKGKDTPVTRKDSGTATCKNCTKLHGLKEEESAQAMWDNSFEAQEARGELAAALKEEEAQEAFIADIFAPELGIDGQPWEPGDNPARRDPEYVQDTPAPIILPTMLTVEHREESPAQADGPSVEVCKVEALPLPGATLPGETSNTPQDSKTPAPRKISKPKVHKPLSEPKLFGDVSGAVHTEDRQNPSADDLVGGAQAGTYRGHTSLTSGRDMTGTMPREREEGGKPVRTTMDMPLGRERLDVSSNVDKVIVQTEHGAKIVTDRVGGRYGFLNGADYHKLSRSAQRRYWVKVKKARTAALAAKSQESKGK